MRNVLLLTVTFVVLLTVPAVTQTTETPVPDAPACASVASADVPVLPENPGSEDGVEGAGIPEPTEMLCSEEWDEYRWVYAGCCVSGLRKAKQQRRHCCFNNSGTTCGSWVDTGAVTCSGLCPS
jgi:hypothetical protein